MALYDCPEVNETEPQRVIEISQENYGITHAPRLLEQMRHLANSGLNRDIIVLCSQYARMCSREYWSRKHREYTCPLPEGFVFKDSAQMLEFVERLDDMSYGSLKLLDIVGLEYSIIGYNNNNRNLRSLSKMGKGQFNQVQTNSGYAMHFALKQGIENIEFCVFFLNVQTDVNKDGETEKVWRQGIFPSVEHQILSGSSMSIQRFIKKCREAQNAQAES